MKTLYLTGLALATLALPLASRAQTGGVRIGTAGAPNASAVLDLSPDATTAPKGLLPPRVTLAQRNNIGSPATGLVVYQTDNVPGLYVYTGSLWVLQTDNLGNHTATQNLNLGTYQLVGGGGSQGLSISGAGALATSSSITAGQGLVVDNLQTNTGTLSPGLRLGGNTSGEGLASKRNAGGNQFGLDFYTSNLNRLSISGAGNVGLGTSAPYSQLANTDTNILGSDGAGGSSSSLAWVANQAGYAGMLYNGSTLSNANGLAVKVNSPAAGALDISRGSTQNGIGTSLLRVLGSGNVGLGTSAPGQLLELGGQAAPILLLHSNGNNLVNGATLQFWESGTTFGWNLRHNNGGSEGGSTDDRLILESANGGGVAPVMTWNQGTGNVGIGTTTPAYPLDVTGDARVSGSLDFGLLTVSNTQSLPPKTLSTVRIFCASGTRLLGGGGGFRQLSLSALDVVLRYNGPDPDNPTTAWLLYAENVSATTARDVFITCNCARIQ